MINLVALFPEAQYKVRNEEPCSRMEASLDAELLERRFIEGRNILTSLLR